MLTIPKRYLQLLLFFSLILLAFFALAGSFIVKHQYDLIMENHAQRTQQEVDLVADFIQESFIKQDFARVHNFLQVWVEKCHCVYKVTAVTADGFVFFDYLRPGAAAENYHLIEKSVQYPPHNSLVLTTYYDTHEAELIIKDLNYKLILMFIAVIIMLITILLIILTKVIFIPMEREIQQRTIELRNANEELKRISQQNQLILTSVGDAICGLDENGYVIFVNPAAAQILAIDANQLIGKHYIEISHHSQENGDLYDENNCPVCITIRDGTICRSSDEFIITNNGKLLPIEYVTAPMEQQQQIIGAVVVFRDITKRKELETVLIRAREAAEQANRVKNQFLANISHELRTPLNAIIGYSELLYEDSLFANLDEFAEYSNNVLHAAQQLLGLVNDVLDIVRLESGKSELNLQQTNLLQLVESSAAIIQPLMEQNHNILHIEYQTSLQYILTDAIKLRQIMLNLLGNAAKFTKNGNVIINISNDMIDDLSYIIIQISDDGIGMTRDNMVNLFHPFQQLDGSSTRKYGGIGLGLSLTKQLVKLFGGKIEVSSQIGIGSSFYVYIPVK
jgi:PAS domain S-box-containing protein